ncbi:MAG: hypothetical protein ACLF0G_17660 [Candidatus Brocadiia bacterium]
MVATAGTHGEADGGVWAWGLDLATGAIQWKRRLYRPERPWQTFQEPDRRGRLRVETCLDDLGYVNRSNGRYCVTAVRNIDLPASCQEVVRAARALLRPGTGELAATPRALTEDRDRRPPTPSFITYDERFPFLDMEFEAPGGPHGTGSWGWGALAGGRSGVRRLAHNGEALIVVQLKHPAPVLHYVPSREAWGRHYLREHEPIASLTGRTDSLVVGGRVAYVAGEGMGEMPWGTGTRPRHRIAKGERIPGHLMAVELPSGRVLAELETDAAVINNGLAVVPGRLVAVCEDGTVRGYGAPAP